jgi:magnesium-transporting ATPase (P-type)
VFKTNIFNNKYLLLGVALMILIQVTFTYAEFMNTIFKSEALNFETWIEIIVISVGVMFVVEFKRYIDRKVFTKV